MKTKCSHCGQHYEIDDQYIGQVVECTTCRQMFVIGNISEQATGAETTPANRYATNNNIATIELQNPGGKMKALVCEMCGSTDLIKQNGLFVCQSCGIKYSVEEARKMMIDGTVNVTGSVKVNRSDDVETMMKRISILMYQKEWDEAKSCCKRALEIAPENADLYLLLYMIDLETPDEASLLNTQLILVDDKNLQEAFRLASPERKKQIQPIIDRRIAQQKQMEINIRRKKEISARREQGEKKANMIAGCILAVLVIIGIVANCLDGCSRN